MLESIAKVVGKEKEKGAKTIPPDKLQEMVKAEVDRILREQGLGGFVSQGKGEKAPYVGRSVAVIPDLDTPTSYDGLNRTLALALGDAAGPDQRPPGGGPGPGQGGLGQGRHQWEALSESQH